jgi:phage shock protein C
MNTKLVRTENDKMIAGICGGLAKYFNIDPAIVRLVFVLAVLSGVSPFVYLLLWIVMPSDAIRPQYTQPVPPVQPIANLPEHPRSAEQWRYDPYTGEKISN